MNILMSTAKKRLAILWFFWFTIIFLLLLIQTLAGVYKDKEITEAWSWFLPTVMPTLSLMIGVLVSDALGMSKKVNYVDKFLYRLSFSLSLLYLVVVSLTILAQPFSELWPLELMKKSQLWQGPLQGLVAAILVIFFMQKEK